MKKMTCLSAAGARRQPDRTSRAPKRTRAEPRAKAVPGTRALFTVITLYYNWGPKSALPLHEAGQLQDLEIVEDGLERRPPLVLGVEHLLDVEGAMPAVDEELQLGRIGQNEVLPGHRELEPDLRRDGRQQLLVSPVAV